MKEVRLCTPEGLYDLAFIWYFPMMLEKFRVDSIKVLLKEIPR